MRMMVAAAYFTPIGDRTCFIVIDLEDPSDIPTICEPMYHLTGARIEMFPVMNFEDLQSGPERAAQAA